MSAPHRYRLKIATTMVVREAGRPAGRNLSTPDDAAALLIAYYERHADDDREHFVALLLDAQNGLNALAPLSIGTLTASLVHPREVFRAAILAGAASVIVAHNHPSGDPNPSREDKRLTAQLVEAGRLLEIRLHDHLIIGSGTGRWVSMAQEGLL